MTKEEAIRRIKAWKLDSDDMEVLSVVIPELAESEDEKVRKTLLRCCDDWEKGQFGCMAKEDVPAIRTYLEKHKDNTEKEYVFRPLAGTDITIAAEQAIEKAKNGDQLVLAFNGMYTPVSKYDSVKGLVDKYNTYLEEQKPIFKKGDRVIWDGEEFNILDVNKDNTYNVGGYIVPFSREGELHPIGQKPVEKPINWTELTWEDINELEDIINKVHYEFRNGIGQESFGKEVLEQFREYKGDEYLDGIEQKPAEPVEWSEEDEHCIELLDTIIDSSALIPKNRIKCHAFLKSLLS